MKPDSRTLRGRFNPVGSHASTGMAGNGHAWGCWTGLRSTGQRDPGGQPVRLRPGPSDLDHPRSPAATRPRLPRPLPPLRQLPLLIATRLVTTPIPLGIHNVHCRWDVGPATRFQAPSLLLISRFRETCWSAASMASWR